MTEHRKTKDRMMLRAATMLELKAKIRKRMGWSDRRTWTAEERRQAMSKYIIKPDFKNGGFVAKRLE